MELYRLSYCLLAVIMFVKQHETAVVHSHNVHLNREREQDGAYISRDRGHMSDSGEHHGEFDHEAIIGSAKEAEEFDHLTPQESKRRLRILLGKMDLSKDMFISRAELKAWILRSFKMLSEEEAKERLEDADENNDGRVTWDEYVADTYGMESGEMPDDNEQLIRDDKIMWKVADQNGDDILEGEEWVAFSHPEEHPSMLPYILEQTLREKDVDGNRAISFQEYLGDRGQDHDKQWLTSEKVKFDTELDKNGDGKLEGNEILSWIVPSNE